MSGCLLWSIVFLVGFHICTGLLEWNLCDEGTAIFDQRSFMGRNTRGILHVNPLDHRVTESHGHHTTDVRWMFLESCKCTLVPLNGYYFDVQYSEKWNTLEIDPSCKLPELSCSDTLHVRAFNWEGKVFGENMMNASNTWKHNLVKKKYIRRVRKLLIEYNRQMPQNPVSVKHLSLKIEATQNLSLHCFQTLISLPDPVHNGSTPLSETTVATVNHATGSKTGHTNMTNSKFIVILLAIGVTGLVILLLIIVITVIRNRKAKEQQEFERRMNPIYREHMTTSSQRHQTGNLVSRSQPVSAGDTVDNLRYVPLEKMYEVKRQNAVPVINDDFTINFSGIQEGHLQEVTEVTEINSRGQQDIQGSSTTAAVTWRDGQEPTVVGERSTSDKPEYKNIPVDDGYQSIVTVNNEQVDENDYSHKNVHNGTVKMLPNGNNRGSIISRDREEGGSEEQKGLLDNGRYLDQNKSDKYYTLWGIDT